ncbi:MAG: hypothetical protein ACXAC7_01825 [Candidatus Hodarchaeales archaeon]|jgi:GTPase SAR1 family protein
MTFESRKKGLEFIGKIAAVGQRGCGKTHLITKLVNQAALEDIFPWDEESQIAGTLSLTPYKIDIPTTGRIIINDNPGHSTLEQIRLSLDKQGNVYRGIIVFADAVGWNFRRIGVYQAEQLRIYSEYFKIPICLIVSKRDLRDKLMEKEVLNEICEFLEQAIENYDSSEEIHFYNRAYRKSESLKCTHSDPQTLPFTFLEQIIANALDEWNKKAMIPNLTFINIRFFVRSLILGFLEYQHNKDQNKGMFLEEDIINRLSYFRPTALETGMDWSDLTIGDVKEPSIKKSLFSKEIIKEVIEEYVTASQMKVKELYENLESLHELNKWNIVCFNYSDTISRKGKEQNFETTKALIDQMIKQSMDKNVFRKEKESPLSNLGLDQF